MVSDSEYKGYGNLLSTDESEYEPSSVGSSESEEEATSTDKIT